MSVAKPSVLADVLPRERNNFDLIRLVAAVTVIFGHSFYLFPTGGHAEPVTQLVSRNFSGTLAVGIFFFLSGIFVTQSYIRSDSPARYSLMRAARIYPGAIVCLVVIAFAIGPVVAAIPLGEYFKSPGVYCYLTSTWSFTHILFSWAGSCGTLPGVFNENRIGSGANGSLWTLYAEVVCYVYVLAFGALGFLKTRFRIAMVLAAMLLLHAVAPHAVPYFSDDHYTDILKVGLSFMAGVAAYASRDMLVIRARYSIPLILAAVVLRSTPAQEYALYAALFYVVLVAAASTSVRAIKLPGDYSFGVYIYGWPIQQTVDHFFPNLQSYPSNLICIPAALLAGYLSWNFVEKPVLTAAHQWKRNRLKIESSPI
jgi:peptidoglycan/LPS O-acetylase OafA/YrhL